MKFSWTSCVGRNYCISRSSKDFCGFSEIVVFSWPSDTLSFTPYILNQWIDLLVCFWLWILAVSSKSTLSPTILWKKEIISHRIQRKCISQNVKIIYCFKTPPFPLRCGIAEWLCKLRKLTMEIGKRRVRCGIMEKLCKLSQSVRKRRTLQSP